MSQIIGLAASGYLRIDWKGGGGWDARRGLALLFELELDSGARSDLLEGVQYASTHVHAITADSTRDVEVRIESCVFRSESGVRI